MLGPELVYTEHERLALANLQTTLRLQALAHSAIASLAVVQLASGTLATGATLGLCIYEFLASGGRAAPCSVMSQGLAPRWAAVHGWQPQGRMGGRSAAPRDLLSNLGCENPARQPAPLGPCRAI